MVKSWDGCWGCSCSAIVDAPQCTVCRQCTPNVRGGSCLSQFQICVCVSGHVLSVSKFSLCQSASAVTKSLRSPVGASFQSVKKKRKAVCWYIETPQDSCRASALRHNRDFNIATAQRPREAMQVVIWINEICSRDTGLCSRSKSVGFQTTYVVYLPSCRKRR